MRTAFTLVELIFVIVIIGILSAVAIPKFAHLSDNAKIASELATASSVQSALDAIHSEWITNTCDFDWGNGQNSSTLNANGYPASLDNSGIFLSIFKTPTKDWSTYTCPAASSGLICYTGPASDPAKGDSRNLSGKPGIGKYWEYNATAGTFLLRP